MALNVALPLSGVVLDDILEGFSLLSPISPSCTDSRETFKTVVSPFGSESSSGVSSFDADEIKVKYLHRKFNPPICSDLVCQTKKIQ